MNGFGLTKTDSRLTKVAGFLRLIRVVNSCAVFVATFVGGLLSVGGQVFSGTRQLLAENGQPLARSGGLLSAQGGLASARAEFGTIALAAASMAFVAAFGYALNDYYDASADAVNRPSRPIPSGMLSRKSVLGVAVFCLLAAALFALKLGVILQLALAGACGLVWLYSARIKRTGLGGNVVVSLLAASTLLFGGLSAGYVRPTFFPALLALLTNLPREILKDVQDLKGDSLAGGRSVVSARGERFALRLASVCMLVLVLVSFVPYLGGLYNRYYLAIVLLLDALLVWVGVTMWDVAARLGTGSERLVPGGGSYMEHRLATAIRILKLTMLAGLLAIGLGSI